MWGKLQTVDGVSVELLLECHLADVAAVFLEIVFLPTVRARLEKAAGRRLTESDLARLTALAALHDLGKITPGFQNKATGERPVHGHIVPIPGLLADRNLVRLVECLPWLAEWSEDDEGETVLDLLLAAFSHHGTPLPDQEDPRRAFLWPERADAPAWRFLASLGESLRCWFPEAFGPSAKPLPGRPELAHLFAGLVMLADWLGSDTRFFPIDREPAAQGADAVTWSRRQARHAVAAIGFDTSPWRAMLTRLPEFVAQFGFAPNALQRAVDVVPLQSEGGLLIIEAETGFGKTEAALRYATRLWSAGLVDGVYFANPLRFAATQLFGRVRAFSDATFRGAGPPTVLAVPGYLRADHADGARLPDFEVRWSDDPGEAEAERRWAAEHPKRFLAAPLAVGTIDQALLAGMRAPHAHMRAAALSRSLLVVDEVHASDAYMTRLTLNVLDVFRRLGGQVLLLSATLGGETRHLYLRAMGAQGAAPGLEECVRAPYPLLSAPAHSLAVADERGPAERKPPVRCRLLPVQDDAAAVAGLAAQRAAEGRVLVLRNTVRDAVRTQAALEALLGDDLSFAVAGVRCAHHSRFARADREMLDAGVERRFGKNGAAEAGALVSTQTLEQSLDVDFDFLITDLCPMDVLLQRLGRQCRHRSRDAFRRTGPEPECLVLTPAGPAGSGAAALRDRSHGYGKDRPYDNLPALMATWELLAELDARDEPLRIPAMSRELVERALHSEALEAVAERCGMRAELTRVLGAHGARGMQGQFASLCWDRPMKSQAWDPRQERFGTRLGAADRMLEFDPPFVSPFGNPVDRLVVPEFLLPKEGWDAEPEIVSHDALRCVFRLGKTTYAYTRFGLDKEED